MSEDKILGVTCTKRNGEQEKYVPESKLISLQSQLDEAKNLLREAMEATFDNEYCDDLLCMDKEWREKARKVVEGGK